MDHLTFLILRSIFIGVKGVEGLVLDEEEDSLEREEQYTSTSSMKSWSTGSELVGVRE